MPKRLWAAVHRNPKRTTLIAMIAFLTILVIIPSLLAVQRVGALADCQSDWNQKFAEAYRVRLESSQISSINLDKILVSVDKDDRGAFRVAVEAYVKARDAQLRDQLNNPYPALPDQYCGDSDEGSTP